jgi:class 3 adenylate cyclase/transcriptional regulator with GAF, ATPase, and Fis domain
MGPKKGIDLHDGSSAVSRSAKAELERQAFHLKTLYDVSKDIFGTVDVEAILRNFLLMTTGNFGVIEGFIVTQDVSSKEITHFVSVGFRDDERTVLSQGGRQILKDWDRKDTVIEGSTLRGCGVLPETIASVLPFSVDETCTGLLGLGSKIVREPYSDDDKNLLITLANNLAISLTNARSFEDIKRLNQDMQEKNVKLEKALDDLDHHVYHLKTLYDVSKDIFGSVDFKTILKNFLLMTMGNFGVTEGFILTLDVPSKEIVHFEYMGCQESSLKTLQRGAQKLLLHGHDGGVFENGAILECPRNLPSSVACALPFTVGPECLGLLAVGSKLIGEPYNEDDKELLITLVNNLAISLTNARSFEDIKRLNQDLQEKNVQLEKALTELQAALKKVEILESIKANLSKFVPTTVTRMIERSPTGDTLDAKERDVSILFLDIEGYTKISERLGSTELNDIIEKYFSVFMDAIYANNGDVNETAGDGLMVLFPSEDETTNALNAVRAALTIREKAGIINKEGKTFSEPLLVNMGINSGRALVGAAKFESYTGSRWTYTARGTTTNLAARIGSLASGGDLLLSRSTADRVKDHFSLKPLGKVSLKNVSEKMEIFSV